VKTLNLGLQVKPAKMEGKQVYGIMPKIMIGGRGGKEERTV